MGHPEDDEEPQEPHFELLSIEEAARHDQAEDEDVGNVMNEDAGRKGEPEYETPNTIKFLCLGTYFFFSLLLTLYNKMVLGSVRITLSSSTVFISAYQYVNS
jgi:hypothetical protein